MQRSTDGTRAARAFQAGTEGDPRTSQPNNAPVTAPGSTFLQTSDTAGRFQRCCQTVCHGDLSVSSFTTSRSQPRLTLTGGAAASEKLSTSWRVELA